MISEGLSFFTSSLHCRWNSSARGPHLSTWDYQLNAKSLTADKSSWIPWIVIGGENLGDIKDDYSTFSLDNLQLKLTITCGGAPISDISRGFFHPLIRSPLIQAKVRREGRAAVQCLLHVSLSATFLQYSLPFFCERVGVTVRRGNLEIWIG